MLVILTLLAAIELPIDLQVIKNNLGIPHQIPPRFENASLNFGKKLIPVHTTVLINYYKSILLY